VGRVVVPFDVIDAHGFGDSGVLIEIEHVAVQIRVIDNAPEMVLPLA
jgi:hypothetical protein